MLLWHQPRPENLSFAGNSGFEGTFIRSGLLIVIVVLNRASGAKPVDVLEVQASRVIVTHGTFKRHGLGRYRKLPNLSSSD